MWRKKLKKILMDKQPKPQSEKLLQYLAKEKGKKKRMAIYQWEN